MNLSIKDQKIKNKAERRIEEEQKEYFLANRMLIVMLAATVFIVSALLIRKNDPFFDAYFIVNFLKWVQLGLGILFAAAVAYFVIQKRRGADEQYKYLSSPFLLCVAALLFACALFYNKIGTMGTVIAMIGAIVLYFIYSFYQRDLFYYSLFTCVGALLVTVCSRGVAHFSFRVLVKYGIRVAAVLLPILLIAAMFMLYKKDGVLTFKGKKYRIMKPNYCYYPFHVVSVITLVGSLACMFFPALLMYSLIALFGALLVIAVVYTINMM